MFRAGCFDSGYGFNGFYGMPSLIMAVPMIIFLGVLIYFVYKLFSHNKNIEYQSTASSAIDILSERFARGEISEEEYLEKKKQLRK